MIRNIILDFGKVLVDYDFDIFFRRYVPDENRRKQFVPILYNDGLTPVVDRGEKPFEEIVEIEGITRDMQVMGDGYVTSAVCSITEDMEEKKHEAN